MIAFAAHEFELNSRQPDGHTLREHLEAAMQATGNRPADLDGPACPSGVDYVWHWFCELSAARGSSGFGPNPLGYADIDAWSRLTGRQPDVFEVSCLMALDGTYFSALQKAKPKD